MAKPYWTDRFKPLTVNELQLLASSDDCWNELIPVKLNGEEVFCYQSKNESKKGRPIGSLLH